VTEYVLGFCFNSSLTTILLIRKTHPAWQAGKLNGVGGKVEEGETPTQAMEREFREEACFETKHGWVQFGSLRGDEWVVHLFHTCVVGTWPPHFFSGHEGPRETVSAHYVDRIVPDRHA